ncbi:hypothetical protein K440DRAFT_642767 [Wilcoxina mikolae CBS 423.85]|nr:hypothetical protein K440DRAFT_642767 [Wilcoxina mikolae CBS 423.85]
MYFGTLWEALNKRHNVIDNGTGQLSAQGINGIKAMKHVSLELIVASLSESVKKGQKCAKICDFNEGFVTKVKIMGAAEAVEGPYKEYAAAHQEIGKLETEQRMEKLCSAKLERIWSWTKSKASPQRKLQGTLALKTITQLNPSPSGNCGPFKLTRSLSGNRGFFKLTPGLSESCGFSDKLSNLLTFDECSQGYQATQQLGPYIRSPMSTSIERPTLCMEQKANDIPPNALDLVKHECQKPSLKKVEPVTELNVPFSRLRSMLGLHRPLSAEILAYAYRFKIEKGY